MTTEVATNNTPRTVVAKPYRRTEDDSDEKNIKVAVKERNLPVIEKVIEIQKPAVAEKATKDPNDEETWKERYANLRRHTQKKDDKIKELEQQLLQTSAKEAITNLPKTKEEVAAWAEQYKESYDIIKTVALTEMSTQLEALQTQIDSLKTSNEQSEQERAAAVLTTLVPNWREFNDDQNFHAWLNEPRRVKFKEIVYNGTDPYEIAEVLETYIARTKPSKKEDEAPKQKPNVDAALAVATPKRAEVSDNADDGYIRESEVKRLTAKQYEEFEDKIDEAIRTGKFIYDVSGAR